MKHFKWVISLVLLLFSVNTLAGLQQGQKLVVDGIERNYDLFIPQLTGTNSNPGKRPLILLYHGHSGSADVMTGTNRKKAPYKIWLTLAEKNNFIVAIPEGARGSNDKQGWNDCRADTTTNPDTDDVKFTLKMIDVINQQHHIDKSRIYATGTSNGGNMVLRLAMEVPEKFAAVAAVVASNPVDNECRERHLPVSVLFMNGTADPILPYKGGKVGNGKHGRGIALSTPKSVAYWVRNNSTRTKPEIMRLPDLDKTDNSTVVRHSYTNGKKGSEVILFSVINGGHTEPSRQEQYRRLYKRIVGNQNYDIEMADEVWMFFKNKIRQ